MIMKSTTELSQKIARTVALLRMLCEREGITSVYEFAAKYDALASPLHPTRDQGKNGWQALFNGARPITIARLRSLSAVDAWSDATTLYENGPANLWRAIWGAPEQLRFVIADELTEWRSFDQVVAEFEGELLIALQCHAPLTLVHLAKSIAIYRLQNDILGLSNVGVLNSVVQCFRDEIVQVEMERLGIRKLVNDALSKLFSIEADCELPCSSVAARWEAVEARLNWVG